MKLKYWFKLGIGIKRWLFKAIVGIITVAASTVFLFLYWSHGFGFILFCLTVTIYGVYLTYDGFVNYTKNMMAVARHDIYNLSLNQKSLGELIYNKKILVNGPKIVVIGGGTGLSNMLIGLKKYTSNITAIVTVADDGGGSGKLREDLGMLPPGDIRNCIIALSHTEPVMEEVLNYRFKDGALENQSFGNLFLAAMNGTSSNFLEAVKKTCNVLAVTGKVLPVTLENVSLYARLKNGTIIEGESSIPKEVIKQQSPVDHVYIKPEKSKAVEEAIDAIHDADAIILGPGSIYTSIIPNLLVDGMTSAIKESNALKILVSNIMTQPGESDNFTVEDHIEAIYNHCGDKIIDYVVVNSGKIEDEYVEKYVHMGAKPVVLKHPKHSKYGIKYIERDIVKADKDYVRHDSAKLAEVLVETVMKKKLYYDDKRLVEFFYLSEKLKEDKGGKD